MFGVLSIRDFMRNREYFISDFKIPNDQIATKSQDLFVIVRRFTNALDPVLISSHL